MAVTAQQVIDLVPDCVVESAIVTSIITDATNFVTATLAECDNLSVSETESIIKWMAAHMVASGPGRQARREKLGDAEVEYDPQSGTDLTSTSFGRMALALDRCGKLKAVGKQAIVIKAVTSFE